MSKVLNGESDDDDKNNKKKEIFDLDATFIPPLKEASITLHVMYEELRLAGFTRREALYLISNVMIASLFGPANEK